MSGRPWTKREDSYLRRNVDRKTCAAIGGKIDRTRHAVQNRLRTLSLSYTKRIAKEPPNAWSKEDKQFLRRNLNRMTCREVGAAIGRSKIAVAGMLIKLGLKRTPAARGRLLEASFFKKGHATWNKGMKGFRPSPETEFKKGHKPIQTKWDGAISIRVHAQTGEKYKYVRIAKAKWIPLHRYRWELKFGQIPPKHILKSKNGDTLDCRVRNWRLLSMAGNIRENSNPQKAAIGLRKAWDEGRFIASDKYIAFTLAPKDGKLRKKVRKYSALIEAKRAELKLRRSLKNADRTTA